ncbi:CHAT domain-containing protein [Burkholderia sp. LMU1-1-1.1]|uniref:CHAT domain-containing protein n=1 Tax=Burkholderia sp. LMU1-1-1.1 TaxID=3135266 RepID=UPI0034193F0F
MHLRYVLVVPDGGAEEDATPFQGWNPVVGDRRFLDLVHLLACLPGSISEIFMTQEELLIWRRNEVFKDVMAVGAQLLNVINFSTDNQITVFLFLPDQLKDVAETQLKHGRLTLLLSPDECPGVLDTRSLSDDHYCSIDDALFKLFSRRGQPVRNLRERYRSYIDLPALHGIVLPNQILLESFGFTLRGPEGVVLESHEQALQLVTETLRSTLLALYGDHWQAGEIIVYAPAAKAFFYDFKNNVWNQVFRQIKEKWKRKLIENLLFKNKSYSSAAVDMGSDVPSNPFADPIFGSIMRWRQIEVYATSAAIGLLSNVENIPSIRLPNAINLHLSELKNLEQLSKRLDEKGKTLLQRKFLVFNNALRAEIGNDILKLMTEQGDACKLCSDVPLEWLYVGRLPLMISHQVSRIPMTPGNMLLQYAASSLPMLLPVRLVYQVLIIRSFKQHDPLRGHLETAVSAYKISAKMTITIVDVESEAEAIDALNGFAGGVVVFDCHGGHGGHEAEGWLQFGNERVNTWELAYRARIPPIVLLSACSTAPIGGSHISVANGLLRSGARSVMGTFLDVGGAHSAVLVARILYRIDQFLMAAKEMQYEAISWRAMITGMLRMSYLTEVLYHFKDVEKIINDEDWRVIHMEGSQGINHLNPNWYEDVLTSLAERTGLDIDALSEKITSDHPLMETMYYSQIGMPERLTIVF